MMGLFFARISRGRTIKQVVVGIIGLGSLGTWVFLSIAGGYVLYLQGNNLLDAVALLNTRGMAPLVAVVISQLPSPTFILTVVTILTVIFYATTFDSAAYILASICTKDLPGVPWWFAYSPMMGLFFARISRGRTIKQVVVGIIGLGSLGTWVFLSIAGGYVLYLQGNNLLDAVALLNTRGMAPLVAVVISQLPSPTFILTVVTILTVIFYATTFDSAAYILASICTKDLPGDQEPGRINRVAWAVGLGLIAASLMVAGGLETVKSMTVVTSLSALPVIFMMCYTLYKWLQQDFPNLAKQEVHTLESR